MSLSELVERAENGLRGNLVELSALAQTALYSAGALYGEHLQAVGQAGEWQYDLLHGQLSDFCTAGAEASLLVGLAYSLAKRSELDEKSTETVARFAASVPIVTLTLLEIQQIWNPDFIFDPIDILAYAGGAALAYCGYKASTKVKNWWDERKAQKEAASSKARLASSSSASLMPKEEL